MFKTTEQIFGIGPGTFGQTLFREIGNEKVPTYPWTGDRDPKIEDILIWEVIAEQGGPLGVYAAYVPYAELYIAVKSGIVIEEHSGWGANQRMEKFLQKNGISYSRGPDKNIQPYEPKLVVL
jgi:hypothetical protein